MQSLSFVRLRVLLSLSLAYVLLLAIAGTARASDTPAWQSADVIQKAMQRAQVALISGDQQGAVEAVAQAQEEYQNLSALIVRTTVLDANEAANAALSLAADAVRGNDEIVFASAYGALWTGLLQIGYDQTLAELQQGDRDTARQWLLLREFRPASRFVRPNTDATRAISSQLATADVLATVRTDLLDTYQTKLDESLRDLAKADARRLSAARAQYAALANGYFVILVPFYETQYGPKVRTDLQRAFAQVRDTARSGQSVATLLPTLESALKGFRAAPLSSEEQTRRAGQMVRFLNLIPVEYKRGVSNGQVTIDLEIQEAVTFRDGAAAAFADLRNLLDIRDPVQTEQIATEFATLEQRLAEAQAKTAIASAEEIQANVDQLTAALQRIMPAEWQGRDSVADFDVISTALDQMEAAVVAGQYDLAESARLEAYAILESGPEAKLVVFAPQFKPVLENQFWYGSADERGLAYLIEQGASTTQIKEMRATLDTTLSEAQKALAGSNAPLSIASNGAIIVFREGLEAVLILASLMGSFKLGEQRKYRGPLWWGTGLAFVASVLTWMLAQGVLRSLARYGERLEAIVSLIAIGVLLLITNWFFHKVYWTGWMTNFHTKKKRILGGSTSLILGLIALGFTSIYREGFETVLFLQALVLESGPSIVLSGVAIGLACTFVVGFIVFALQAKLPHKKMLIVTGIMIGVVLLQMVGKTVNVMQLLGWLSLHPIRWLSLPYWTGLWFGLYASWEGIAIQVAAATFVIGSYFLAERSQKRAHLRGKG